MSGVIQKLRQPKFPLLGKRVAVFDVTATALGGYLVAEKMGWNKPVTIVDRAVCCGSFDPRGVERGNRI